MERRKICIYCETWESGGIESFLRNVLMRMDLSALSVDIVTACLGHSVFTSELEALGVRFRQLSGSQRNLPKNRRLFRQLLQEQRYDVVHLNIFQGMSLYYAHLAKKAGVPIRIAHSHNTNLRKSPTRQLKLWLHRLYRGRYAADATALWACSHSAAEFMFPQQLLQKRGFIFIPNGIDTARFRFDSAIRNQVRQELGVTDAFVIGNIGRLCYQKNQSFLLETFREVVRMRPESRLLLVGEGADAELLRKKAQALRIEDRVIFYGVTDHPEWLLWAMDVFVMPSRFEGLPVTALEAQACGLPCIFSDAITLECDVGGRSLFLPLSAGAAQWAKQIANCLEIQPQGHEIVYAAGFDVRQVAETILKQYEGNNEWSR